MSFTHSFFRPEQHCPLPFLGHKTPLPELTGYRDDIREALEYPILDPSELQRACEAIELVSSGYDLKLPEEKWGVISARVLEALFWKVLSLEKVALKNECEGVIQPSKFQVYCESCTFYDIGRILNVYAFWAPDGTVKVKYPQTSSVMPYISREEEGNARASAFWTPLSPISIIMALSAWEALRFTPHKNENGEPRRFEVDLDKVRSHGPLSAMSDLFGHQCAAQMQAWRLLQTVPDQHTGCARRPVHRL